MLSLVLFTLMLGCGPGAPAPLKHGTLENAAAASRPASESSDIMNREAQSNFTKVKHILISWDKGDGKAHPNAVGRSEKEAEEKAVMLLGRVNAGEDMDSLMSEFSEDPGSAQSGISYDVTPDAGLVFEFKRMGLRLHLDESGLVLSDFGWHIIKRVE